MGQHYRLYGADVFSDIALMQSASVHTALPKEPAAAIRLYLTTDRAPGALPTTPAIGKFMTHGRTVTLHQEERHPLAETQVDYLFQVEALMQFRWSAGDDVIECVCAPDSPPGLAAFWFVHHCLPIYLSTRRSVQFMHASAVEIDNHAVLFVAPSMGGKSTMAEYCLSQGHGLLADDKILLRVSSSQCMAVPSHPYYRPWREHEVLGSLAESYCEEAIALKAIYQLEQLDTGGETEISPIQGWQKFEALSSNHIYDFLQVPRERMQWLSEVADYSPMFRVRRVMERSQMRAVYASILEHSNGLEVA